MKKDAFWIQINSRGIPAQVVVAGRGITLEEATRDHDHKLTTFLKRCQEHGLKLDSEKLSLRQTEVAFMGNVGSRDGLRVNPAKVKTVLEMPAPTDKTGIQRLLGMIQYLSKVSTTPVGHDQAP